MVKRRLDNPHQRRPKRETNNHRDTERESYLHDGPTQVFQMLEKRLGRFGLRRIAKFENVLQRHQVAFVRMPSDFSSTPGFSQVQPTERTTTSFNGFELNWKPLKRLAGHSLFRTRLKPGRTRLKPGVTENSGTISHGGGASDKRPRAASVAQMPSVLASRISLSAIMRRISSLVNPRQSRIDSPSSQSGPSVQG